MISAFQFSAKKVLESLNLFPTGLSQLTKLNRVAWMGFPEPHVTRTSLRNPTRPLSHIRGLFFFNRERLALKSDSTEEQLRRGK